MNLNLDSFDGRITTLQDHLPPIRGQDRIIAHNFIQAESDSKYTRQQPGYRDGYHVEPLSNRAESIERFGNGQHNRSFERKFLPIEQRNLDGNDPGSPHRFVRSLGVMDEKKKKAEYGDYLRQQMREKEMMKGIEKKNARPDLGYNQRGGFLSDKEFEKKKKQEYGDYLKQQVYQSFKNLNSCR